MTVDDLERLARAQAPCPEPCTDPSCVLARAVITYTNIERNKRDGLLCACNAVLVPYYPEPDHGSVTTPDGIIHEYEDCQ